MAKVSGIYTITNLLDGKIYVGQTSDFTRRKSRHITQLQNNTHDNEHLQRSVNKYSLSSFNIEMLVECDKELLNSEEHYWANLLNTFNKNYGYNLRRTHPYVGVSRGYKKRSTFTIAKQEACKKSIILAQDSMRGKERTKEHIKNLTLSRHGKLRKIEVYNLDGSFYGSYDFIQDAVKETGVKMGSIKNNVQGRSKSTKKFTFKYKII